MHADLYRRFVEARATSTAVGRMMPYDWLELPPRRHGMWMVYFSMLDDYAREIANAINAFTSNVRRLSVWTGLLATFDEKERSETLHEFVDPMATLCLLTPYCRHLCGSIAADLCDRASVSPGQS